MLVQSKVKTYSISVLSLVLVLSVVYTWFSTSFSIVLDLVLFHVKSWFSPSLGLSWLSPGFIDGSVYVLSVVKVWLTCRFT